VIAKSKEIFFIGISFLYEARFGILKNTMIASITGTIQSKTDRSVIIDVQGVGYEVFISPLLLEQVAKGADLSLFTHQYVREDMMDLYGFATAEELEFFKQLIEISGVGPKSALTVMSLTSVAELKSAIVHEDASLLMKVSGIGKKTAERIVVELKNKIDYIETAQGKNATSAAGDSRAIDGLVALGYSVREARESLRAVDVDITGTEQRIKAALKLLGTTK